MPKTTGNELTARFPTPHLVMAALPDDEHLDTHSAQRLLLRLVKKMPTQRDYAVTNSARVKI